MQLPTLLKINGKQATDSILNLFLVSEFSNEFIMKKKGHIMERESRYTNSNRKIYS